jgi:hypothetical protein
VTGPAHRRQYRQAAGAIGSGLLELRGNAAECRVQIGANCVYSGDDRDRNARSDQGVLNGRGTRLVLQEPSEKLRQANLLGFFVPGWKNTTRRVVVT